MLATDVALGWPLRYSHSPAEVVDVRDVEALGKIIAEIAKSWQVAAGAAKQTAPFASIGNRSPGVKSVYGNVQHHRARSGHSKRRTCFQGNSRAFGTGLILRCFRFLIASILTLTL